MQYLVWVEAENAAEAHAVVHSDPWEWVGGDTQPVDAWLDGEEDPDETARFIWLYGSDFMPQHDAHVHRHRWTMRTGEVSR